MNGESLPYDINLRACSRIMNLMNFTHSIKYRPSSNHGDADYFCYKIMPLKKFPFKVETPTEYKDSRIRTSLFLTETQNGPVFKSPTLSDFEWMKRKRKGYINDNNLFPSHLLNFWSNPWHVWEKISVFSVIFENKMIESFRSTISFLICTKESRLVNLGMLAKPVLIIEIGHSNRQEIN